MIGRYQDWAERLNAYIESARHIPFAWGANDCGHFAVGAVKELTGIEVRNWLRDDNHSVSVEQAVAILAQDYEFPEIPSRRATRGDLVLHDRCERGPGLAIVDTTGRQAVAPGPDGLVTIPMADWRRAWRIE